MMADGVIFNPNPTVFQPTKGSTRKRSSGKVPLWLDDNGDPLEESEFDEKADELETIDQDEIFGARLAIVMEL